MEGKAGNLTDLTSGMVLAEKPLTWLQIIHEILKHLIISSEMFKEKKKAKYIMLEQRQRKTMLEKGWENTPRELGLWGLLERKREGQQD